MSTMATMKAHILQRQHCQSTPKGLQHQTTLPYHHFLSSTRHCRRQHRSLTQNPAKAQHYFLSSFESVKPSHPIVILLQKHALNSSYAYHDNVNAEIIFQHSYSTTVSLGIPNTAYRNYRVMSILPSINTSLSHTREQDTNKNCLAPNP